MNGFNTSGALTTNSNAINPLSLGQSLNSNPVSTALNNSQSPNFTTSSGQNVYVPPPSNPTPTTPVSKMKVTQPNGTVVETTHDTSSPGSYKGVPIVAGDQASIQAQIAAIDAKGSSPGIYNPNVGMQTQTGQSTGLVDNSEAALNNPNYGLITQGLNGPSIATPSGTQIPSQNQNLNGQATDTGISTLNTPNNNQTFAGLLGGITAAGSKTESEQNATADQIAQLRNNLQTDTGLIQSEPFTTLNFQGGRLNALQNQEQAKEANLQGQLSNEIAAGTQNIGALTSAAGLSQPSPAGYGQTVFNPLTGQYSGGSSGVSTSDPFYATMQTYAQALANNQPTSIPSSVSGNPVLQAQLLQMAQAINPNFNYNTSQGIGAGQAQAGGNTVQYAQAVGKAQPIAANLDTLIQQNGINPTNITYVNGAINFLNSNFGTSAQQSAITEFNGQLNDLASTLAPALGIPGGATTDFKTSLGQSIVNGLQNGQSVQQSIQYFISQAQQGALGAAGGAANPTNTLNGTSNVSGSSLYNF